MNDRDLHSELTKNGYLQIENFLGDEQALQLRKAIVKANHHRTWDIITTPYNPFVIGKDRINSNVIDKRRHKVAKKANNRGQFAFSFYRSNNKHKRFHRSDNIHRDFSQQLLAKLSTNLEIEGKIVDSFFASFIRDQFIGYHSDGNIGKYAFIYQLSKGWQRKFGGQLVLYPKQNKFNKITLEPKFNCLTLLNLSFPMFHSVNLLKNPDHKHRVTISGWVT